MDYPDPHNESFDTVYGNKTTGNRQAWVNDAFDEELKAGGETLSLSAAARGPALRPAVGLGPDDPAR